MITDKQKDNIYHLPADDCLEILHVCAERLGLVSIEEYEEIMQIPRRTIYFNMDRGLIKYFKIGKHKFPLINI
jgi:hypothetical protein